MYHNVHCSSIYNSQDMEATQVSIDRGMDKQNVVYPYNAILLALKRKTILTCTVSWMDLENIMLSEISQSLKDKYCMNPLI